MKEIATNYSEAIQTIKDVILKSRYRAAVLANRELLSLSYGIGKYISENSRTGFWGTGAIETISEKLQQELPGLRGFSAGNLKKMRTFYEEWQGIEGEDFINRSLLMNEFEIQDFTKDSDFPLQHFLQLGFTHHSEIIYNEKSREGRLFYIQKCASEFWSVEKLKYHLKSKLFEK